MNRCHRCGKEFGGQDVLCRACGAVVLPPEESEISCENHRGEKAVACCVVCGKPVCGDCATSSDGVFVCDMPEHRQSAKDWSVVAMARDPFEADMLKVNLVQAGFPVHVADPREFNGTLVLRRPLPVRVMVERTNLESAVALLSALQLFGPES